jgi:hypothetical protein
MRLTAWLRLQWDRVAAGALVVSGLVAIAAGWFGATGTVYPAQQIPYVLSGGLAGITLAGLGAALWVSADLKDEWLALRRLEALLDPPGEAGDVPLEWPQPTLATGSDH